jgi:hypothetical protein
VVDKIQKTAKDKKLVFELVNKKWNLNSICLIKKRKFTH